MEVRDAIVLLLAMLVCEDDLTPMKAQQYVNKFDKLGYGIENTRYPSDVSIAVRELQNA